MQVQMEVGTITATTAAATARIGSKTKEYQIYVSPNSISIATGNALLLRSPGKTFATTEAVRTHYKTDGETLAAIVNELKAMIGDHTP